MEPINNAERTKLISGFAALYLAAVVLVGVIFFSLGNSFSTGKVTTDNPATVSAQDEKLLTLIKKQQDELRKLQQVRNAASRSDTSKAQSPQLKTELQQKDDYIATLEEELKMWQDDKAYTTNDIITTLKKETETLKLLVASKEKEISSLKNVNSSLDNDIKTLNTQLTSTRTSANNTEVEVIKNKYAALEHRYQQLNADLDFAKIDCNLTRADSKQIISNSKQRKELLSEALDILNDLSKSENDEIQKRANNKITQLSQIVSTIRD
jgi:chromosome segregation ATPase